MVECQLPKLEVAGSSPVARSKYYEINKPKRREQPFLQITSSSGWAGLGHVYAATDNKSEARRVLDDLKKASAQQYFPAIRIALIYEDLGEKDQVAISMWWF